MKPPINQIGHGGPGLRAPLRDFDDLLELSCGRRIPLIEARPTVVINGWSAFSSDTWRAPANLQGFGNVYDIIGVVTLIEHLTRVESVSECDSTAGSYFYDADSGIIEHLWDDGTLWDAGFTWDTPDAFLYVHLSDGSDPSGTTVVASVGIFFSTLPMVEPSFGPDLYLNGNLESWSMGAPANFAVVTSGAGWGVTQDTAIFRGGASAAHFASAGSAAGNAGLRQLFSAQVGKMYRVTAAYREQYPQPDTAAMELLVGDGTLFLASDGRFYSSGSKIVLPEVWDNWRRFVFDFVAFSTDVRVTLRLANSAATACNAWVDDFKLFRIHRFNRYEPRVTALPASSVSRPDIYWGKPSVNTGGLSLANDFQQGKGYLDFTMGVPFQWPGAAVVLRQGGVFPSGEEITFDDARRAYAGTVQNLSLKDLHAEVSISDLRNTFEAFFPLRFYDRNSVPDVAEKAIGQPRPLLFGAKTNMRPVRIARGSASGLGWYEVCDPDRKPGDEAMVSVQAVYAYPDEQTASVADVGRRVLLADEDDYTKVPSLGQIQLLKNPGPFEVIAGENDLIDWQASTTLLRAQVAAGLYSGQGIIDAVEAAMNASPNKPAGTVTVTYTVSTHKITIAWGGLSIAALLTGSGANADKAIWGLIGYQRPTKITIVTGVNDRLDFDIGAAEVSATLAAGEYSPHALATEVQTKMRAVGAGDETCVYNTPPDTAARAAVQIFIIGKAAGTLNLRTATGTHLATTAYHDLAFSTSGNKTGALSYLADWAFDDKAGNASSWTSDVALFEDADTNTFLTVDATGIGDDSAGTYTGSSGAAIQKAGDVLLCLLVNYLRANPEQVDFTSFISARTTAPQLLAVLLGRGGQRDPLTKVVERLEAGANADFVLHGGNFYFVVRHNADGSETTVTDQDIIDFQCGLDLGAIYSVARVAYDQDPGSGGDWKSADANIPAVALQYGVYQTRTFETYFNNGGDAITRAVAISLVADQPIRIHSFRVARRLMLHKIGDIVIVDRVRGLVSSALTYGPAAVRIFRIDVEPITGAASVTAVTNIV